MDRRDDELTQGLFPLAHHFTISNSNIVHSQGISENKLIDLLAAHTIDGAEYDSSERDPPPKCHPGTRLDIMERIQLWVHDLHREKKVLWLHGSVGVGKSSIMQTLAENESDSLNLILGATFFFSRPNKRDDPQRLFTTIAYQLAVRYPLYRKYVNDILENDPRVIKKSMVEQFKWFIVKPFTAQNVICETHTTILVVLDGLDECKDVEAQREIVFLIGRFARAHPGSPLIWAVASRPEPHLRAAFFSSQVRGCCWDLDVPMDSYESLADVERFLMDGFREIRERYSPFFPSTNQPWPSQHDFLVISRASAGLFIIASLVIRFIQDENYGNPIAQLKKVIDSIQSNPQTALNKLYAEILAAVPPETLLVTKKLLGLVRTRHPFVLSCNWLRLSEVDAYGALQKLHSVIKVPPPHEVSFEHTRLKPFHTSFFDYISSPLSGEFYIEDPYKDLVTSAIQVMSESHNPRQLYFNSLWTSMLLKKVMTGECVIQASRVRVSWPKGEDIHKKLLAASFKVVISNVSTLSSSILRDKIVAFFGDLDYGDFESVAYRNLNFSFGYELTGWASVVSLRVFSIELTKYTTPLSTTRILPFFPLLLNGESLVR